MEILIVAFFGLAGLAVWMLPFILVAMSDRTSGNEKIAWLLAMIFVTWFAWIFYILLAPLKTSSD